MPDKIASVEPRFPALCLNGTTQLPGGFLWYNNNALLNAAIDPLAHFTLPGYLPLALQLLITVISTVSSLLFVICIS